jgi:hypothetical protein
MSPGHTSTLYPIKGITLSHKSSTTITSVSITILFSKNFLIYDEIILQEAQPYSLIAYVGDF